MTKKKRKIHLLKENSDTMINLMLIILIICGTLMIISTNVGQTTQNSKVVLTTLIKQIIIIVISYICMIGANKFTVFRYKSIFQVGACLAMICLLFVPFLFPAVNGAKSWILLGPFSIQPSEFAKPFIVVAIAYAVKNYQAQRRKEKQTKPFHKAYRGVLVLIIAVFAIVMVQKDTGTAIIILMIAFVCLIVPQFEEHRTVIKNLKRLFMAGCIGILVLFCFTDIGIKFIEKTPFSHIAVRFENMKNPYDDVYDEGYQPANALYGIANSNITGRGIGNSDRKYGYLTQADNDYIFAVLIEETGIFGLAILVGCYGTLIYRLFYYARKAKKIEHKIVFMGNITYLFMHFFLNVGGVTCLIPMTGVPLLFISSGGSSLMAIMAMFGVSQRCISDMHNEGGN
ncbi:FtsW/RodA/SpoVE family cell cycle protein [Floccifex sp.]|uniref:FtsW/RodA/SpoVE family cell cycle protein n=1 Tax=Floccifex sp. TaxID=2815810 RepID=UPI002A75F17E|nr:FtsW/RodA/SpoVE family cell cycle protein [Floccifex sp.]MDD7280833.1 FtsW/RodA/SpoVE family cell cycle protein [Erysipelotrichaceae bacterium]MDY2958178.1 FtsW/RodA/SpoVE family cell cycle protein [Floccifex sp.]